VGGLILYIDDENQLPEGFREDLRTEGFDLVHVDDPDWASRLVRVDEPDLVLMELLLSTCDGLALLEAIRGFGGWPAQVPVIVLTKGERSPQLYGRALELEVKEFLTKPALRSQLLQSVREFAGQAPAPEPTLRGDLADLPMAEILQCLRQDAATGVLRLTHRKTQRFIEFRNGSPVAVGSAGGVEAPEDYLARRKRISEKQRRSVKARASAGRGSSVEILVDMGALSGAELGAALREQAEEQFLETFRWTAGPFGFFPDQGVESAAALAIDGSPAALILRGVLDWSPAALVSAALRERAALYVSREERPPYDLDELALSSAERVFLDHMNGDRSIREVLDSGDLGERKLYGLFIAGFLVFHREPVMVLLEEVGAPRPTSRRAAGARPTPPLEPPRSASLEPPIAPSTPFPEPSPLAARPALPRPRPAAPPPAPSPTPAARRPAAPEPRPAPAARRARTPEPRPAPPPRRPAAPEPRPAPPAARRPAPPKAPAPPPKAPHRGSIVPVTKAAPPAPQAARIDSTLTELCERIASQDDFGVLGVTERCSDEAVRTAYEALLASIPFDALPPDEEDLQELAGRVRHRIELAFAHLATADSRRAYTALRREEDETRQKKDAAARAFEAESSFRKGEACLRAKKYAQAVEAFGMSAHLDPKEGEYASHLGYALYLSNPQEPVVVREALEHIAKGIKLSPKREKSYLYLGRIFRANGAEDRARKMFERAVRIKPDFHAALQELRLLDLREQKRGSLLKRLLGT
jgi:DNA-binding response OmpR family regulator